LAKDTRAGLPLARSPSEQFRLCDEAKPGQILIRPRVLIAVVETARVHATYSPPKPQTSVRQRRSVSVFGPQRPRRRATVATVLRGTAAPLALWSARMTDSGHLTEGLCAKKGAPSLARPRPVARPGHIGEMYLGLKILGSFVLLVKD
jgi:hypothetical protein